MKTAVPVIQFSEPDAAQAFEAYQALIQTQMARPELAANPYWQPVRDSAFARFRAAFEVLE